MSVHIEVEGSIGTQTAKCKVDVPLSAIGVTGDRTVDRRIISKFQAKAIKDIITSHAPATCLDTAQPAHAETSNNAYIEPHTDPTTVQTTNSTRPTICDICCRCLGSQTEKCKKFHDSSFCAGCATTVGECHHAYHLYCIADWLRYSYDCRDNDCDDKWRTQTYSVSVISPANKTFNVELASSNSILKLKQYLQPSSMIRAEYQRLFFNGQELDNMIGLYDAGLDDGSTLRLEYTYTWPAVPSRNTARAATTPHR